MGTTRLRAPLLFTLVARSLLGDSDSGQELAVRLEHFSNGDVGLIDSRPIGLESLSLAASWRLP